MRVPEGKPLRDKPVALRVTEEEKAALAAVRGQFPFGVTDCNLALMLLGILTYWRGRKGQPLTLDRQELIAAVHAIHPPG